MMQIKIQKKSAQKKIGKQNIGLKMDGCVGNVRDFCHMVTSPMTKKHMKSVNRLLSSRSGRVWGTSL